jgi:hypothetical protein
VGSTTRAKFFLASSHLLLQHFGLKCNFRAEVLGDVIEDWTVKHDPISPPSILMIVGVLSSSSMLPMIPNNFFLSASRTGVGLYKTPISFFLVTKRRAAT